MQLHCGFFHGRLLLDGSEFIFSLYIFMQPLLKFKVVFPFLLEVAVTVWENRSIFLNC